MKRVKARAASALLLAVLLLAGMAVYVLRFAREGERWVMFSANENVYQGGVLTLGTLTDRSGVFLAGTVEGERCYSDDALVRTACLHAVGDFAGNIGTGAVTAFADKLTGYDPVSGVAGSGTVTALSIDSRLNAAAWQALDGRRGTVLLMDYTTGELLTLVSSPAYDPAAGFDPADPAMEGVYLDRGLSAAYTPGSVFKLVTLCAALETIPDLDERRFSCTGSRDINGFILNCTAAHGQQTVEQALANSCNCAFAQLSLELGAETLGRYADALGLTQSHSVSGIATLPGRFDPAPAGSADLAWSGIGQYTDLVNPYALLRYVAAIANGGTAVEGRLLLNDSASSAPLLRAETAERLAEMMHYTVTYAYGESTFPGLKLAAKSGTAETGDGSSHAWFTGFLADDDHPYAFCVVLENSGSGLRQAGAVANALLQQAVNPMESNGDSTP